MNPLPKISVVVPCRNEERFIRRCIESILQSDYPRDRLEMFIVDGMSEDGTWDIIEEYRRTYSFVHGLRNPKRITPSALNLGIAGASGEIIFRIDAHALVAPDYLRLSVDSLFNSSADNVGGAMQTLPSSTGIVARAIALAISHPFGAGNSRFRVPPRKPVATDTVFGGCYRREVFDRIGLFNEQLPRGQDMEFNRRLSRAGGKILLDPRLKSSYYSSPDFKTFWRRNLSDGEWAIRPFAYSRVVPIRTRHSVPLVCAVAACVLTILGTWQPAARVLLCALVAAYMLLSLACSTQIALRERDSRFFFIMPPAFGIRHVAYGLGSLIGMARLFCQAAVRSRSA